ncbi:MAG: YHS domain-containing (seleno)protein [Cyanobacteria bacterium J06626_18]
METPATEEAVAANEPAPSTAEVTPSTTAEDTVLTAEAAPASDPAPAAVFSENGVAIRGADPVAYFTQGSYVAGSADYTYEWGGAIWQFASAENRDSFASSPGQYAPQYGGFCAWAVSQGYTAPVDPTAWEIVDGKLYLNFDARIQRRWEQDIPGHIASADQNWPAVVSN